MPKQHYFDQKGEIVYTIKNTTCDGCIYQKRKENGKKCNTIVPVEHMRVGLHGMYCVEKMLSYKKLK